MLSPIPRRILRDTLSLDVPSGFDGYQSPVDVTTYTVTNVHFQGDNSTHKTANNTEVTLRGIIFVDAHHSTPSLDYETLQSTVQALGGQMTCSITTRRGTTLGPFSVAVVEALPDDEDNLHHWEIGVV